MATAAELKAKLAKYAKSSNTQIPHRAADDNTAGTGTVRQAPGMEPPSEDKVVQNSDTVRSEVQSATSTVLQEVNDDAPKATEVAAPATQEHSVRTEGVVTVDSPVAAEVIVRTDIQSTDVVVVERPVEPTVVSGGDGRNAGQAMESGTDLDVTNPIHQGFLQRLNDLEAALLDRDPLMKTHLGEIHKAMIQYEEIANLLRPEEIAKIMAAQQQHTGMVLRAETLGKSKASASKKAAGLGLNDV